MKKKTSIKVHSQQSIQHLCFDSISINCIGLFRNFKRLSGNSAVFSVNVLADHDTLPNPNRQGNI